MKDIEDNGYINIENMNILKDINMNIRSYMIV